jgi:hypothetical protein
MYSIVHYGDEWIELNGRRYHWDDFLKVEPHYTVPYGWKTRVYKRGEVHYISDGQNSLRQPLKCKYCDEVCDREGELARLVAFLKAEREVS